MRAWAQDESGKLQGNARKNQETITAARETLLDNLDRQAAHQQNPSSIARVFQEKYDKVTTYSYGIAIECPSLIKRKRYTFYLNITNIKAIEEKNLTLKNRIDANVRLIRFRKYFYSYIELEIAKLLQKIRKNK